MALIRQAEPTDVPHLLPMVAAYWAEEGICGFDQQRVEAQVRRLLADPRLGSGWIAIAGGTAVGYLLAVYVFSLEHLGLTAEIDEFFVVAENRGKGIGAELLKVAEAEFERVECNNVSFQLSRENEEARRFYRRHGYTERSGYELLEKELRT